jgi:hypothetical protein
MADYRKPSQQRFVQPRTNLGKGPAQVGDLLARAIGRPSLAPTLARITAESKRQSSQQNFWRSWFTGRLPGDLADKVSSIVEQGGRLTITAGSAAWSTRLRYAVMELESAIRAEDTSITEIRVRVQPGASAR